MKITVNKESDIPIRDQLIEQLGLQIASGTLKGKEKLPSIRALAQRLGIHYSTVTAAYNHLADAGLLEVRQGSGVRVAGRPPVEGRHQVSDLDELLRDFLAKVSDSGASRDELCQRLKCVMTPKPVRRIVAVDRNRDFHPILLNELKPHFSVPVETMTVHEILQNHSSVDDALVVTSLYHLFAFEDAILDPTRLVVCNIEPAGIELSSIASASPGSLVALISGSQTIMNMATKLFASLRTDIGVRSVLASDRTEVDYLIKHADLILCDSSSKDVVVPLASKKKVLIFRLYSPSTIELIKSRLEKWG